MEVYLLKYLILFLFSLSTHASQFANRSFLFPKEKTFVSDFRFTFKRWNYEYEDEDLPLNEDLLEVEKEAILFEPELRYGLKSNASLIIGFTYQFEVLSAHLEEQVGADEVYIASAEERALHSPYFGMRYRILDHKDTYLDFQGIATIKTHKNLDPTFSDLSSQIVNGSHILSLSSFYGMTIFNDILRLSLTYNHHFDFDKRFALFDETYNASNFYNIEFGIGYTFIFDYGDDLEISILSSITDNFQVQSGNNVINFKENVTRQFGLRYTNYTFKETFGLLYFDFKQVFELNSFSYQANTISIESDNTYTRFSLGLTTQY